MDACMRGKKGYNAQQRKKGRENFGRAPKYANWFGVLLRKSSFLPVVLFSFFLPHSSSLLSCFPLPPPLLLFYLLSSHSLVFPLPPLYSERELCSRLCFRFCVFSTPWHRYCALIFLANRKRLGDEENSERGDGTLQRETEQRL